MQSEMADMIKKAINAKTVRGRNEEAKEERGALLGEWPCLFASPLLKEEMQIEGRGKKKVTTVTAKVAKLQISLL